MAEVVEVPVDHQGRLDLDELRAAVMSDPALVSIMWANNETGVIFPVDEVAEICRAAKVPFHCDATQAIGKIPADFRSLAAWMLPASRPTSSTDPRGSGRCTAGAGFDFDRCCSVDRRNAGRRGGTENVPAIVGFGVAAELCGAGFGQMQHVRELRDSLENGILGHITDTSVNGEHRQAPAKHHEHQLRPAGGRGNPVAAQ